MKTYHWLFVLLLLTGCKTEKHYFQNALESYAPQFSSSDTLIFPFFGKMRSNYPYSRGKLIAYYEGKKLKVVEYGDWVHYYSEDDTSMTWSTATYDTLGLGLIIKFEANNLLNNKPLYQTACKDTTINSIKVRKCDYKVYSDNSKLKSKYSMVTFKNPWDSAQKYGKEVEYDETGKVVSTIIHKPKIMKGKISK